MKIEYVLTCDDYVQFQLYQQQKLREHFRGLRIFWPMVGLISLSGISFFFACCFGFWKGLLFYLIPLFPDRNYIFAILAGGTTALILVVIVIDRPWERMNKYDSIAGLQRRVRADQLKGKNFVGYSCELILGTEEIVLVVQREREARGASYSHKHEMRVAWFQVKSIDEFDLHTFVVTKTSEGIFIPKAAFADALAFRAFVAEARRLWVAGPTTALATSLPPAPIRTEIQPRPGP
jgi:hypothetical protein